MTVKWRNVQIDQTDEAAYCVVTTRPCVVCDTESVFTLHKRNITEWMGGTLIQEAFPELSHMERETLVSGVCSQRCWDKLWDVKK